MNYVYHAFLERGSPVRKGTRSIQSGKVRSREKRRKRESGAWIIDNLVHHHICRLFGRDERKDHWTTNATPPKREAKPVGVKVRKEKKGWEGI